MKNGWDEENALWVETERNVMRGGVTITVFIADELVMRMDREALDRHLRRTLNRLAAEAMEQYDKRQELKKMGETGETNVR